MNKTVILIPFKALKNKMPANVGYIRSSPLSVDTEEDLIEVKNLMEKK